MMNVTDALCITCLAEGRTTPIRWRAGEPRWCAACYAAFLREERTRRAVQCIAPEAAPAVNRESHAEECRTAPGTARP